MAQDKYNGIYKVAHAGGSGSCFYLKSHNIFVTNYHVVKGYRQVAIHDDDFNSCSAKVVLVNPSVDLALLATQEDFSAVTDLELADEVSPQRGDHVCVAGYPYGMPLTITEGVISSPKQTIENREVIQIDAAINPGNSGGPVFSEQNKIIGVSVAKITEADNIGFVIPVKALRELLDSIETLNREHFSVQCESCDELIEEEEEYCPCCGEKLDEKSFEEEPLSPIAQYCEEAIQEIGVDPIIARDGCEQWEFYKGSSRISIAVVDDNDCISCISQINLLPKKNVEAVLDFMLSEDLYPYKMGVDGRQIYIIYRAHLSDLGTEEGRAFVKQGICGLAQKADDLDDFLVKEFGCEYAQKTKKELVDNA